MIALRAYLTAGTAAVVGASALGIAPASRTIASEDLALPLISTTITLSALDLPFLAELSQRALPGNAPAPAAAVSPQVVDTPSASSITTPIEVAIKDTYDFIEPWVAYAAEVTQYVLGFIPAVWWLAPAIDLAYFTIEPLVQAGVYVVADVIGLNFDQIIPDISAGIAESISNAAYFALAWLESLVPLPPLPPFPPFPGAAVDRSELVRSAASRGAAVTPAVETPVADTPVVEAPVVRTVTDPVVGSPVVEAPVAKTVSAPVANNEDVTEESVIVTKESPVSAADLRNTAAVSDTDTTEVAPDANTEDEAAVSALPVVNDISPDATVTDTVVSDSPPAADISAADTPAQDTKSKNTRSRNSSRAGR
jgi:hypothetical protein